MTRPSPELSSQRRNQWLVVALVLAALGLVFGYLVLREYRLTLEREHDRLLTHSRVVDENLGQQLAGAHAALSNIGDDMELLLQAGRLAEISRRLKALSDAMPGVGTMMALDGNGRVFAASRAELIGQEAGDQPFFERPRATPARDTLYVSEPFQTAPNEYSLNLARIWTDRQGRFAGVVTATLDPAYFRVLLRSALYAEQTRSTLVHGQGQVLLAIPPAPIPQGLNLSGAKSFFQQHRAAGRSESLFTGTTFATGEERIVALRSTQPAELHMDQPLVATVSRPVAAVLGPWRSLASVYALLYCLLAGTVWVAVRQLQHKGRALAELQAAREQESHEQAQQLQMALAGADLGLWDLNLENGKRSVNARAQEMVGCTPDDPVDSIAQWGARAHPDDLDAALAARHAHEAGQTEAFVSDYRIRHRDGHWVWIHSRGKVTHRGPDGRALRIAGTYLDMTERMAAQAESRRAADLLARMSRVSRTGGWEFDLRTGHSSWSPEMFRIRELDPSVQPDQQLAMDAFLPESRELLAQARAAAINQQMPWDLELQMTTAKGNLIWVQSQGEAVVENGRTVGLTGTLKNVTLRKQTQIDLNNANAQLERMALSDGLTGIANRRQFDQTLLAEWSRSTRSGQPLALLMLDIDHFKLYNDHYGHVGGDECLRRVARVLSRCTRRAGDLVCRFGGEEFAILLPGADLASASAVARSCLDTLRQEQIAHAASPVGPWLSMSIGVASTVADAARSAQTLVEHADAALYRAKHGGRAHFATLEGAPP